MLVLEAVGVPVAVVEVPVVVLCKVDLDPVETEFVVVVADVVPELVTAVTAAPPAPPLASVVSLLSPLTS